MIDWSRSQRDSGSKKVENRVWGFVKRGLGQLFLKGKEESKVLAVVHSMPRDRVKRGWLERERDVKGIIAQNIKVIHTIRS